MELEARIDGALGKRPADLLVTNGRIVNVFTQEIINGDIAIVGDRIVSVGVVPDGAKGPETQVLEAEERYVVPGYVDAHFHVGGSQLPVDELGVAMLERGTTSLATDLYEMYAMYGLDGVRTCIELAETSGIKLLFMAPLHLLGLEKYGTFSHTPDPEEFIEMVGWAQTVAVNEPPPFVVLRGNTDVLRVIETALSQRKVFQGHAVGISGADLQGYVTAGASSDHEAIEAEEALEKLRLGYRVMMREGSASRDLDALAPLLSRYPASSRYFMVCSDELEPKDFVAEGHVDHKLRRVVAAGIDPVVAVQLATINIADYFGLADDIGSVTPGKRADILLLEELSSFKPAVVIANGDVVARDGTYVAERSRAAPPEELRSRVVLAKEPEAADFALGATIENGQAEVRVIGIVDGTLVSDALTHTCEIRDGEILADLASDVLKVAVLERHHGSGRTGLGFMSGLKLGEGAVAMTYCHVHHNLLVVGASDEEIAAAAREITRIGGGIVVVRGEEIVQSLPLPTAGILGSGTLAEMHAALTDVENAIRSLGCELAAPILSLSFSVLPHIPAYGLTDFGFYDTIAEEFVDVVLSVQQ